MAKKLFIIDAMAMAFRSYYAFGARPLTTSTGVPTSAVYGSAVFLNKLISEEKPDFLAVATDSGQPTFRHELYAGYKANRSKMPEDLATQIPYLFRLFEALQIPLLKEGGLEADDLIGCMAKKFAKEDLHVYIVSGDKDFMQLINPQVFLYSPKKGEDAVIIDAKGVEKKFGCKPEQVIDCLALIGDSSDNVPGVAGIGEKGAALLIDKFHSLEGVYENLDKITNKRQKEGLANHKDEAFLSKKLVTIKTDFPIHLTLEDIHCDPQSALANNELLHLYEELEFRLLVDKTKSALDSVAKPVESSLSKLNAIEHEYQLINSREAIANLVEKLLRSEEFCFDTETTGLDIINDRPVGMSFATEKAKAYYVPLDEKHLLDDLTAKDVLKMMTPALQGASVKVGHNLKFDLQMMNNVGTPLKGPFLDTMICSFLLDSNSREHGLDACCRKHLHYEKIPTKALLGERMDGSMLDAPIQKLTEYAGEDADFTLRLAQVLKAEIKANELGRVLEEVEMPLVPILADMEQQGIFVDAEVLSEISDTLAVKADELQKTIYEVAGEEFNINSTKQLQVILFEKLKVHEELGIKRLKKTKSGYSTDVSVLEKLSAHPLPGSILEYRTVTKLKNTYVDTLPQLINPTSKRIHTSFHQTGAATGRLSSADPNLQNIPIRSPFGKEIRKAFRPQNKNFKILAADYSQVELRLLAHMSGDENLAQAFREGQDIHSSTAARIFNLDLADVDHESRAKAKAINFGIIYGMGPSRLARETGVSMKDAKDFIERYFDSYPKIKSYIDSCISTARELGYSTTLTGRRRPIPGLTSRDRMTVVNAENIAVNAPIQGSAADLIKLAMIKVAADLERTGLPAKMLLQVHDELVFECHQDATDDVSRLVEENMASAMTLDVPLVVDVGIGCNWLEAH